MLDRERCNRIKDLILTENYDYLSWDKLCYNDYEKDILHGIRNGLIYFNNHGTFKPFIKKIFEESVEALRSQGCDIKKLIEKLVNV